MPKNESAWQIPCPHCRELVPVDLTEIAGALMCVDSAAKPQPIEQAEVVPDQDIDSDNELTGIDEKSAIQAMTGCRGDKCY